MRRAVPWRRVPGGAAALALRHWGDGPGPMAADYAQYLGHARALAEGRPYTDTGYIFTERFRIAGPAAQPPGLPLVLWAVFRTVGESALAVKLVLLAGALGFYVLAGLYFARHDDRRLGLAVVLLLGLSTNAAHWATVVQSDLLFSAMVWLVVLLYDRDGPFTMPRVVAITVLGSFTLICRTFGVALIPAAALFTLLQWRGPRFTPAIPAAIWVAAFLATTAALPIISGFVTNVPAMLMWRARMVVDRALSYRFALFDALLYPFPWDHANQLYHILAAVVMLGGLAGWFFQGFRRFSVSFCAAYVALLMVVPVLDTRYMWPVSPARAFGWVRGLALLAGRVRPPSPAGLRPGFALAVSAIIGVLNVTWAERPATRAPSLATRPDVQALFRELMRLAAQEPMRVAFVRPQILALETRIPSMPTFPPAPPGGVDPIDRKCITHVVLGDLGLAPRADSAFREAVRLQPGGFRQEYQNQSFTTYRYTTLQCRRDLRRRRRPPR